MNYLKNNILIAVLVFSSLAVIFTLPVYENPEKWGQKDWDQFIMWNAVPHKTITVYNQIPLWNPYVNGGNVMLAHPHAPFLSPFFIFVLIFGPVMGLKIQITVYTFVGLMGMYLLARYLGMKSISAYFSSFVFMFCSIYSLHLTEGHTEWLVMAVVPWFFLFYFKSIADLRYVFAAIISLSLILLNGSVDVFNILIVFVTVFTVFKSFQLRKMIPAKVLMYIFAGTFMLCAVKLIPMLDFLGHNPRLTDETSGVTLKVLFHMLLNPDQGLLDMMDWVEGYRMGLEYEWHEYGSYVGWIPLILCLIGSVRLFEKHWPMICAGLVSLLIAVGSDSLLNLWGALHRLPFFDSLTVPSRFILGFIFYLSIISGLTFNEFYQYIEKKSRTAKNYLFIIPVALFGLVLIDMYQSSSPVFKNAFRLEQKVLPENMLFAQRYRKALFYEDYLVNSSIYPVYKSNSGILDAYEVVQLKQGDLKAQGEPGYLG